MDASEAVDQAAPQLQSATVDESTLTLAYDEAAGRKPTRRP